MIDGRIVTGRQLAFGAGAMGAVSVIKAVMQLTYLPIMARLLNPAEFGLYALAFPIVSFATTLADGGLGASLAREPESSTLVWSTAFWLLLATGVGLAIGVTGSGVLLGAVTGQPRLPGLVGVMSLSLVLYSMTVTAAARLTRGGRIAVSAACDLASTTAGIVVAISCAYDGLGASSFAVQYVAAMGVRAVWLNCAAFQRPRLEFQLKALRSHLTTSGSIIGQNLVDLGERLAGNALISFTLGASGLGYYTFSTQIAKFIADAGGNPIWAALYVKALHGSRQATLHTYEQTCRVFGSILIPASILGAAAAPDFMHLLLGPAWSEAATVFRIILPLYAASVICSRVGALLLAYGRNDVTFLSYCVLSAGRLAAIVICARWGLIWVAAGVDIALAIYCFVIMRLAAKVTEIRPMRLFGSLVWPFAAGVFAAAIFLITSALFGSSSPLLLAGLALAVLGAMSLLVTANRRQLSSDVSDVVRLIKGQRT